jgi:hypothetical protein
MKITRNNLAFFPSFKTGRPTRCGDKLLQTLLVRAAPVLGRTSTSAQTRYNHHRPHNNRGSAHAWAPQARVDARRDAYDLQPYRHIALLPPVTCVRWCAPAVANIVLCTSAPTTRAHGHHWRRVLNATIPFLSLSLSLSPTFARWSVARITAQPSPFGAPPQSTRNMATLRELELRLKFVQNIEKIPKVSK